MKDLVELAARYETKGFLLKDPSQFMHRFDEAVEQELIAFIAANLAFGRREQILKHVELILSDMNNSKLKPSQWIVKQKYKLFFAQGNKSFYRMFTHDSMILFFDVLKMMIEKSGSLGEFVKTQCNTQACDVPLCQQIASFFPADCNLIPHTKESSCKRINMFLRWMVRDNSPVDLGLWKWIDKKMLLMPMDTHVMQQACELEFLNRTSSGKIPSATMKNCIMLTNRLKEFFPEDPVKADFALFGYGVDN